MTAMQLKTITSFSVILGAALSGGRLASWFRLPMISGFLLTGLLAGPSLLGFLGEGDLHFLQPLDHWALAFIAFAAGFELDLNLLKARFKSILCLMGGLTMATFTLSALTLISLKAWVPFLAEAPMAVTLSAGMLLGTIMVARSPSAAIAIIKELKANGPFTQLALGVTVLMDVMVVALFAVVLLLSKALVSGQALSLDVLAHVGGELLCSGLIGGAVALLFSALMRLFDKPQVRGGSFLIALALVPLSASLWGEVLSFEPLLACLVAGALLRVRLNERHEEVEGALGHFAPWVYLTFFTLTGAGLELSELSLMWPLTLLFFGVRLVGLKLGSELGARVSGEPPTQRGFYWMGFVTQAGVGLGLAKQVAHEFPAWGPSFATLMISVIVLNELTGPLFFRHAIVRSGDASKEVAPNA